MKMNKKFGIVLVAVSILFTLGLTSCGVAGFGVTVNVDDTSIPLSGMTTTLKVQGEFGVSTGNLGTDISKIIYTYTAHNASSADMTLTVKLSLYGEAADGELVTRVILSNGTEDPDWLKDPYHNILKDYNGNTAGWVYLIDGLSVPAGDTVTKVVTIEDNDVISQILKQNTIWIVGDNVAGMSITGNMELSNQSIQVEGSKATGYYPGFFGTM